MCDKCHKPPHETPDTSNRISIELSDTDSPKFVVNGVDIAPKITTDWSLSRGDDPTDGRLTVSFPVFLP